MSDTPSVTSRILRVLREVAGGPPWSAAELHDELKIHGATLQRGIDRLERAGMLVKVKGEPDRWRAARDAGEIRRRQLRK